MFNRRIVLCVSILCLVAAPAFAKCISLTFDTDGVLPSAQGFTFVGTAAETSVFSVSGGSLHLNSLGTRAVAYYSRAGAYDPARDFDLRIRMRTFTVTAPFGLDFEVSDAVRDYEFGFMTDGVYLPPPRPFLPLPPTNDGFHRYRIFSPGGSHHYTLWMDGEVLFEGDLSEGGDPASRFAFGDATFDADSAADIDSIEFCQPDETIPAVIDFKPDDATNVVNPRSKGVVPVAIFGSTRLPANMIDLASVTFARAPVAKKPSGAFQAAISDINGDGIPDLLLHFETQRLILAGNPAEALLLGRLLDGSTIRGSDIVRIVP